MRLLRALSCVMAGGAAMAARCVAGPLDMGVVHPQARWVVHVDVEALMSSPMGAHLAAKLGQPGPEGPRHSLLDRFRRDFGLDPATDVKSVTVFGMPGQVDDGVTVLTATRQADGMGERIKEAGFEGAVTTQGKEFVVHQWSMKGRSFYAAVHAGRREDERYVVIADSKVVLDQGMASVAPDRAVEGVARTLPAAHPRAGSLLFALAADLNAPGDPKPRSEIFQRAKSLVLDIGLMASPDPASGDLVYGEGSIVTGDHAEAEQVREKVQGVFAFLAADTADRPADQTVIAELLKGISITTEDARCMMSSRHTAATVTGVLDMMHERRMRARRESLERRHPVREGECGPEGAGGAGRAPGASPGPPPEKREKRIEAAPGKGPK